MNKKTEFVLNAYFRGYMIKEGEDPTSVKLLPLKLEDVLDSGGKGAPDIDTIEKERAENKIRKQLGLPSVAEEKTKLSKMKNKEITQK